MDIEDDSYEQTVEEAHVFLCVLRGEDESSLGLTELQLTSCKQKLADLIWQNEQRMVSMEHLPNLPTSSSLLLTMTVFYFFTSFLYGRANFAVVYVPACLFSVFLSFFLWPVSGTHMWKIRNWVAVFLFMLSFMNLLFCLLPFTWECFSVWNRFKYNAPRAEHEVLNTLYETTDPNVYVEKGTMDKFFDFWMAIYAFSVLSACAQTTMAAYQARSNDMFY